MIKSSEAPSERTRALSRAGPRYARLKAHAGRAGRSANNRKFCLLPIHPVSRQWANPNRAAGHIVRCGPDSACDPRPPRLEGRIDCVIGIGGYYDTKAVVTFINTGHFRAHCEQTWQIAHPHPAAKWLFLKSNIDRLTVPSDRGALTKLAERKLDQPSAPTEDLRARMSPKAAPPYDLFVNTEANRLEQLICALPGSVKNRMNELSLKNRELDRLTGRLVLIHGREDTMIPYTESMDLADAVPKTELFLIDGFSHIDPSIVGAVGKIQLVRAVQAILERRYPIEAN
ncbi:MAG TPA: hypothetical protein EYQ81_13300 [Sneathiellales bacterium]|nr:hypothetical protein [Sneathiellales bacterium]